jgi:hypothetical protein
MFFGIQVQATALQVIVMVVAIGEFQSRYGAVESWVSVFGIPISKPLASSIAEGEGNWRDFVELRDQPLP